MGDGLPFAWHAKPFGAYPTESGDLAVHKQVGTSPEGHPKYGVEPSFVMRLVEPAKWRHDDWSAELVSGGVGKLNVWLIQDGAACGHELYATYEVEIPGYAEEDEPAQEAS